jgi:hypothetical protein
MKPEEDSLQGHPLVHVLSQINPVHATPSHISKSVVKLSIHLNLGLPNGLFLSGLLANVLYAFIFFSIYAT